MKHELFNTKEVKAIMKKVIASGENDNSLFVDFTEKTGYPDGHRFVFQRGKSKINKCRVVHYAQRPFSIDPKAFTYAGETLLMTPKEVEEVVQVLNEWATPNKLTLKEIAHGKETLKILEDFEKAPHTFKYHKDYYDIDGSWANPFVEKDYNFTAFLTMCYNFTAASKEDMLLDVSHQRQPLPEDESGANSFEEIFKLHWNGDEMEVWRKPDNGLYWNCPHLQQRPNRVELHKRTNDAAGFCEAFVVYLCEL